MNRLARIIENLDDEELKLIKKDLDAGNIEKLVNQKLKERQEADFNKVCPVCQTPIQEDSISIIFGPTGLRKKASFCALDCLEYFIAKIKEEKAGQHIAEKREFEKGWL